MPEFIDCTIKELKAKAKVRGLKGYSTLRKHQLLALLLKNSTVAELKADARAKGLKGYSRLRKSELIELLTNNKRPAKWLDSEWFIITKKGCGYCDGAKKLLKKSGKKYHYRVITDKNKNSIYAQVDSLTGKYRYFPMIFHKGKFIGGFADLDKMNIV